MITITKEMIEAMHANSRNVEAEFNGGKFTGNSIEMKDEDLGLVITVYSEFIDMEYILSEIHDEGKDDEEQLYDNSAFIQDDCEIVIQCEDEYVLEADAEEYLLEMQKDFIDVNRDAKIQEILGILDIANS